MRWKGRQIGKIMESHTTIFTREELNRIRENNVNGRKVITVDLHQMKCKTAKTFLKNLIALNFRQSFELDVIHGYNNGTDLKEMIRTQHLSDRVNGIEGCPWNAGMTKMQVSA